MGIVAESVVPWKISTVTLHVPTTECIRMHDIASNDFIAAADIVIIITSPICTEYGWSEPVVTFTLDAQACLHLK